MYVQKTEYMYVDKCNLWCKKHIPQLVKRLCKGVAMRILALPRIAVTEVLYKSLCKINTSVNCHTFIVKLSL